MITITRGADYTEWNTSGKLAEMQRQAKKGEVSKAVYLLCWQITFYGEDYVKQLPQTENVSIALHWMIES